jgi:hypothetical protein
VIEGKGLADEAMLARKVRQIVDISTSLICSPNMSVVIPFRCDGGWGDHATVQAVLPSSLKDINPPNPIDCSGV